MDTDRLRPVERRVLGLAESGHDQTEIARRFRRSPEHIARLIDLAQLEGRQSSSHDGETLRPLERRVLKWRDQGASLDDIARRFRRSAGHIGRVEQLARYKLDSAQH